MRSAPPARIDARPAVVEALRGVAPGPVYNAAGWTPAVGETMWRNLLRPPLPAVWGLATTFEPDFDLTELSWSRAATARFRELQREDPEAALAVARRRGVRAILRLRGDVRVRGGALVAPEQADALVDAVLLERPRPFAFCAARLRRFAGPAGWASVVRGLGEAAADTVLVDESEPGEWPQEPAPGQVTVLERRPARLRLEVAGAGPGQSVLALNQTWDEFWEARVDGQAVALARVDLSLSALLVPPGLHRVDLEYRDPWMRAGLALSGASALALVLLARRRAPRPAAGRARQPGHGSSCW